MLPKIERMVRNLANRESRATHEECDSAAKDPKSLRSRKLDLIQELSLYRAQSPKLLRNGQKRRFDASHKRLVNASCQSRPVHVSKVSGSPGSAQNSMVDPGPQPGLVFGDPPWTGTQRPIHMVSTVGRPRFPALGDQVAAEQGRHQ